MDPVQICNTALAHIGDRRITQLDQAAQESNALVRLCAEFYDQARKVTLAAHRWSFAKKAAILTRNPAAVLFGPFRFSHYLPEDHIRTMKLHRGGPPVDGIDPPYTGQIDHFQIMSGEIWSNDEYIGLEYIFDNQDPAKWTPHFQAAVARLMAHYIAGALADNPAMAARMLEIYERNDLPNAQFYDSVQDNSGENGFRDQGTRLAGSPSLRSRRSGAGYARDPYGHTP